MHSSHVLAATIAVLLAGPLSAAQGLQDLTVPLPIVRRTIAASDASLFGKPDVIVLARVIQKCDTEQQSDVSGHTPLDPSIVRSFVGRNGQPIRVNERTTDDPDLSSELFYFRAPIEGPSAPQMALGGTYLLMLDAVQFFPAGPEYNVAHPQVGFEVIGDADRRRVRPIIRGGELDKFDGRPLDDVIQYIKSERK
jgi:hypothetical protein